MVEYAADGVEHPDANWPWKRSTLPSIHMPRGLCRLTLEITRVRVEPLQAITEADARAEGAVAMFEMDIAGFVHGHAIPPVFHRVGFRSLWCEINGRESWAANPFVWVIGFRVVEFRRMERVNEPRTEP